MKPIYVYVGTNKFAAARLMANAGIPFAFVSTINRGTLGKVAHQFTGAVMDLQNDSDYKIEIVGSNVKKNPNRRVRRQQRVKNSLRRTRLYMSGRRISHPGGRGALPRRVRLPVTTDPRKFKRKLRRAGIRVNPSAPVAARLRRAQSRVLKGSTLDLARRRYGKRAKAPQIMKARNTLAEHNARFFVQAKYKNEAWSPMAMVKTKELAIELARYYVKIGRGKVVAKVLKG